MPDALFVEITSALETLGDGAPSFTVTVDPSDPEEATVQVDNPLMLSWVTEPLVAAGLHVTFARSSLRVRRVPQSHADRAAARARVLAAGDIPTERLQLAWCLWRLWGRARSAVLREVWRHAVECDRVDGDVAFGVASSGACDTCFHEYPAVLFWVRCGCGLLSVGSAKAPHDLPDDATHRLGFQLPAVLAEMGELRDRFFAEDPAYPIWLPGLSRVRRAAGVKP